MTKRTNLLTKLSVLERPQWIIPEIMRDKIVQLFELSLRINQETEFCAFCDLSGHVDTISIKVKNSKNLIYGLGEITQRMHKVELRIHPWSSEAHEDFEKSLNGKLDDHIRDLQTILTKKWEKTYTAYCNLIEMGCREVFISEGEAQRWVAKMKKKYSKVNATVGYNEKLVDVEKVCNNVDGVFARL